jgi:ATP-dependent Zn protease
MDLLNSNKPSLNTIAEYLLEKENITGDEFMRLLGAKAIAQGK